MPSISKHFLLIESVKEAYSLYKRMRFSSLHCTHHKGLDSLANVLGEAAYSPLGLYDEIFRRYSKELIEVLGELTRYKNDILSFLASRINAWTGSSDPLFHLYVVGNIISEHLVLLTGLTETMPAITYFYAVKRLFDKHGIAVKGIDIDKSISFIENKCFPISSWIIGGDNYPETQYAEECLAAIKGFLSNEEILKAIATFSDEYPRAVVESLKQYLSLVSSRVLGKKTIVALSLDDIASMKPSGDEIIVYNDREIEEALVSMSLLALPLYGEYGLYGRWAASPLYQRYVALQRAMIRRSWIYRAYLALTIIDEKLFNRRLCYCIEPRANSMVVKITYPVSKQVVITRETDAKICGERPSPRCTKRLSLHLVKLLLT